MLLPKTVRSTLQLLAILCNASITLVRILVLLVHATTCREAPATMQIMNLQAGEFQCYDGRALASLASAAAAVDEPEWGKEGPHDAGEYNSWPEVLLACLLASAQRCSKEPSHPTFCIMKRPC